MESQELDTVDLIQHEAELSAMISQLRKASTLAVDTESNSLFAYRERVCLIQFSVPSEDFMIDPFAVPDLSPLGTIFGDPGIEKVFHAAEYDLLCLRRDFGFEVRNLFDTMAAARILGRTEIGLGSLLEAEFGVRVEKRYQRANWGQRPLPADLLAYARLDTHYLIALRDLLEAELKQRELTALAQEDFLRLASNSLDENGNSNGSGRPANCWRISGSFDLSPHQAAVLQALCEYRDDTARQLDRPLFKVFNDRTLLEIASQTPQSLDELRRMPGMSPGQIRRHGQNLLRAVSHGLSSPPVRPPRSPRPDSATSERLEVLRDWRKQAGIRMGVPSDVVLPRDIMQNLAVKNPRNEAELADAMQTIPWRFEHFGDEILKVMINGKSKD